MATPAHHLDRTVVIHATPDTVFRYFTDSERWAAWWGAGSTIDARIGGRVFIRYPTGDEASGRVVELRPPERIVFTYGYERGTPIAPGASTVTIRLAPIASGTRLELMHEFADAGVRDEHVQGWRYMLSMFANVVADAQAVDVASTIDAWFSAWNESDAALRQQSLRRIAADGVQLRDRFSMIDGLDELLPHVAATQRFMPGMRLARAGAIRHCQGRVLSDWIARRDDGTTTASGTNCFELQTDGRIASVTGFWNLQPQPEG
jgi:uncharacterized protein YndB with AHSA1/START domain